jgi:hypothetical protein
MPRRNGPIVRPNVDEVDVSPEKGKDKADQAKNFAETGKIRVGTTKYPPEIGGQNHPKFIRPHCFIFVSALSSLYYQVTSAIFHTANRYVRPAPGRS